jgi:S1-C subfamily serine protease
VTTALLLLALALPAAPAPPADDLRETAREVMAEQGDAVVTVRLTIKSRMVFQGQERSGPDQTVEIAGTVLTPDGLTAVSDFTSNPAGLLSGTGGGPTVETQTSDVKLVLRDGRELKARFVLRDEDLDLAFLAPVEPAKLKAVELTRGATPRALDDLILLYPLGRNLGRGLAVSLTRVRSVVSRPRTFVVTDTIDGWQALGAPAFDARGRALGLVLVRRAPQPSTSGGGGMRQLFDTIPPVVLTAEDVLVVAVQAAAAARRK